MNQFSNRRRFRRTVLVTQVVCEGNNSAACVASRNISEGGILLETGQFSPGEQVRLAFRQPGARVLRRTPGIVVWRNEFGGAGIQFSSAKESRVEPDAA